MRVCSSQPSRCLSGPTPASSFEYTLNLLLNLRGLGYGHVLLLTTQRDVCDAVRAAIPGQACGWCDRPFPPRTLSQRMYAVERLWHSRWNVMARALRMGYNMLSLDTDLYVTEDVYQVGG